MAAYNKSIFVLAPAVTIEPVCSAGITLQNNSWNLLIIACIFAYITPAKAV